MSSSLSKPSCLPRRTCELAPGIRPGGPYRIFSWWDPNQFRAATDRNVRWHSRAYDKPGDHTHCLLTWKAIYHGTMAYQVNDAGWITVDAYEKHIRDDVLRLRRAITNPWSRSVCFRRPEMDASGPRPNLRARVEALRRALVESRRWRIPGPAPITHSQASNPQGWRPLLARGVLAFKDRQEVDQPLVGAQLIDEAPIRLDPVDLRDDGLVIDGYVGGDVDRVVRVNEDSDEVVFFQRGVISLHAPHCGREREWASSPNAPTASSNPAHWGDPDRSQTGKPSLRLWCGY